MRTLWVAGDSTLSSFTDKYYYPRYGYATMLKEYLDNDIEVKNMALSGRSSVSFCDEKEYGEIFDNIKKDDILLLGFGHNDEKKEKGRYSSACGDLNDNGSFAWSLFNNYIKKAENAEAKVILCTPIVRRSPDGKWTSEMLHITEKQGNFEGGDYPEAIRKLGQDTGIPVIDMTEITKSLYDNMGPENTCYLHSWLSDKKTSVDNTHTNIWGARVNAFLCLRECKRLDAAGLASHIIGVDMNAEIPERKEYLVSSKEYKPIRFNPNLKESVYWKTFDGWKGTVFGDVSSDSIPGKYVLEPTENGVHIKVMSNSGKISNVTDGIAMYYKKIPAHVKFVFKAKVHINDYFRNDQVSFGLMARDDIYVDTSVLDILGDYVAAAPLLLTDDSSPVNCFARKSSVLTYGPRCKKGIKPGDDIELMIEGTQDGYACTFGDENTVTGGFDFRLTAIDPENIYIGMFASRNADVSFSDISLKFI